MTLSVENNQSTGIMVPTIAAAAGGAVGGTVLAPAKYRSFEQLVNAAQDEVKFSEKTNGLEGDAKKAADTVGKALNETQEKLGKLNKADLFKDGNPNVDDVLKALDENAPNADELKTIKAKADAADIIKKAGKVGEGIQITAEQAKAIDGKLPNGFVIQTTGEGDKAVSKIVSTTVKEAEDRLEAAEKALAGAGDNATDTLKNDVKAAKDALAQEMAVVDDAINVRAKNAQFIAIADGATEGKVTKETVEGALKTAGEELQTAFNTIKKTLGKNKWLGAAIGVAGGLVAGLGIKAVIDGKKNA